MNIGLGNLCINFELFLIFQHVSEFLYNQMKSTHSQSQGILRAHTLVGGSSISPDPKLPSLSAELGNTELIIGCGPTLSSTSQFQ